MRSRTITAFGQELTKIAFYRTLKGGFENELEKVAVLGAVRKAISTGWHGIEDAKRPELKQGWRGFGRARDYNKMGLIGKGFDNLMSLGGATKYLPVGAKSMMVLGAGLGAHQALKKQDASGQERTRGERMTGLAANTVGGLAGVGFAMKAMPGSPLLANLAGGIGGGLLADRVVTAPWRAGRKRRMARANLDRMGAAPQNYYPSQPQEGEVPQ